MLIIFLIPTKIRLFPNSVPERELQIEAWRDEQHGN